MDSLLNYADRHPQGLDGFLEDLEATAGLPVLAQWGGQGKYLSGQLSRWPKAEVPSWGQLIEVNRVRKSCKLPLLKRDLAGTLWLRVMFGEEAWTPSGSKLSGVAGNRMVPVVGIRAQNRQGERLLARLRAPSLEEGS